MLRNTKQLKGFAIRAMDGEIGVVDQLYFDDESWAVRDLAVYTGNWLSGRQVLVSPVAIMHTDWDAGLIHVSLTKKQVEQNPDISMKLPGTASDFVGRQSEDSHLRSTQGLTGYNIYAEDGEIGHLDGFVMEDESWSLRYIEVATRNWWPGKKVLVSPAWIERVSWTSPELYLSLLRNAIKTAPEYEESKAITREYESQLYFHYGRPPYWADDVEHVESLSLRDA
jgi:hypothetical protein